MQHSNAPIVHINTLAPIFKRNRSFQGKYKSTMKFSLSLLTLPIVARSQLSCPDPLGHTYAVNDELTMYFDLVLSEPNITDGSILCARFESQSTGWIGFGISPTKGMVGAEAVIGVPADGTVKKYVLFGKDVSAVTPMDEADQTLMDTSITQDAEGRTTMTFTKYLFEDKYGIIPNDFINSFIWATGSSNELGYHGATRGNFGMDLLTTLPPSSSPPTVAAELSTLAPSVTTAETSTSPTITAAAETSEPTLLVTTSSAATEGKDSTPAPSAVAKEEIADGTPAPSVADQPSEESSSPTMVSDPIQTSSSSPVASPLFTNAPAAEAQTTESTIATIETTVAPNATELIVTEDEQEETTSDVEDEGGDETEVEDEVEEASNEVDFSTDGLEDDNSSAFSFEAGGFLLVYGTMLSLLLGL